MSWTKEAACLRLGLLVALAGATTACSAPYKSGYILSGGVSLSRPVINGRDGSTGPAGRLTFLPVEFGAVGGGLRPGWSLAAYPLEADFFGNANVPQALPGGAQRFHRFSAGALGARLYLFSHFVKGMAPKYASTPINRVRYRTASVSSSRAMYQAVAVGAEVKIAPLAVGLLGNLAEAKFYDGFGEAALFATTSIPHGLGASLDVRAGTQYAVGSGGTFFVRLELSLPGSRRRELTQDEMNMTDQDWQGDDAH